MSKIALFQVNAILRFDSQKRKQLHFSEENYLNYTKKTQFCIWRLHLANKNKQWAHYSALKCDTKDSFAIYTNTNSRNLLKSFWSGNEAQQFLINFWLRLRCRRKHNV